MNFVKVFNPEGKYALTFAADDRKGIEKWLGDVKYEDAILSAKYSSDDPVYYVALTFPCDLYEEYE